MFSDYWQVHVNAQWHLMMSICIVSTESSLYLSLGFWHESSGRGCWLYPEWTAACKTLQIKLYPLVATAAGWIELPVSGALRLTFSRCNQGVEIRHRAWNPLQALTQLAEIEMAVEGPADRISSSLRKR